MREPRETLELAGYGIRLTRVAESDLETLLRWRNAPEARRVWISGAEGISMRRMREWLASLKPDRDYFFIVWVGGRRAGLIFYRNVDRERNRCEPGILMAEEWARGGDYAFRASVLFSEYGDRLKIPRGEVMVGCDNPAAQRLNAALGYEPVGMFNDSWIYRQNWKKFLAFRERMVRLWLKEKEQDGDP